MSELIKYFRAHREEVWAELSHHLVAGENEWDGSEIRVKHGPFSIVLDRNAEGGGYASRLVTRIRAAFINKDGFRGRLRRANWLSELSKMLGTQDIEVGDAAFDAAFVVQANNAELVKELFADTRLRELLIASPLDLCEVRDDEGVFGPEFPEGVDELYAHSRRSLVSVDEVGSLYSAFAEILNRLCHAGSAYEDDPHLEL